jgi:ABC-type Fe3+/spermidine/putrescine transport system ATPase subunit
MRSGRILQSGPPEEVYRRPRTAFVARFVGISTLIPGRADESGRLHTELGEFETSARPGTDVILALRPETCRLNGADGVAGEVHRARFLGDRWLLAVRVGEREVLCVSDRERNVGETVKIAVEPAPVTVVDDEEDV